MENMIEDLRARAEALAADISALPMHDRVTALNDVRRALHKASPMQSEPVDLILWVPAGDVQANDYNPNSVAPPEMKLLERSILHDGYTQPVVTMSVESSFEVIDGFHRSKVGKTSKEVQIRTHGYLPVTIINPEREDRSDRIAATIRHNRARGKHAVDKMSDIVVELVRRRWSDERIADELGMDADEILRLKQVTGLAEMFQDREFSSAWEIDEEALK